MYAGHATHTVNWGNSHQNRVNGCKRIEDGDRVGARHAK